MIGFNNCIGSGKRSVCVGGGGSCGDVGRITFSAARIAKGLRLRDGLAWASRDSLDVALEGHCGEASGVSMSVFLGCAPRLAILSCPLTAVWVGGLVGICIELGRGRGSSVESPGLCHGLGHSLAVGLFGWEIGAEEMGNSSFFRWLTTSMSE